MNRLRLFKGILAAGRGWFAGARVGAAGPRGGWYSVRVRPPVVTGEGGPGGGGKRHTDRNWVPALENGERG